MFPPRYSNPDYWKESGIVQESRFQMSLSGGKGGQNVNKVSTKAEIYWSPEKSTVISEDARARILEKIPSKRLMVLKTLDAVDEYLARKNH